MSTGRLLHIDGLEIQHTPPTITHGLAEEEQRRMKLRLDFHGCTMPTSAICMIESRACKGSKRN